MINFWAVMTDETGCEFGAGVQAPDRATARDMLRDMYPESRIAQLESPEDTRRREAEIYERVRREMDGPDYLDEDEYCEECGETLGSHWDCPNCGS